MFQIISHERLHYQLGSFPRSQNNNTMLAQQIQAVALIKAGIAAKIVIATVELSHQTVY